MYILAIYAVFVLPTGKEIAKKIALLRKIKKICNMYKNNLVILNKNCDFKIAEFLMFVVVFFFL